MDGQNSNQQYSFPGTAQQQIVGQQYIQPHAMAPPSTSSLVTSADERRRSHGDSSNSDSDAIRTTPTTGNERYKKSPLSKSMDQFKHAIHKLEADIENYVRDKEKDNNMAKLQKTRTFIEGTLKQIHRIHTTVYEAIEEPKPMEPIDSLKEYLVRNGRQHIVTAFEQQQQQQRI
ncbi:uncharacterized protein LOC116338348 [Contarinia nasturtii]|uniref:uncharacterized protein LOC116338348 n=1 Tax=Contarinia nasturtii TaxID=265458 RepID=UPI0012D400D3|nr:uncharacterized protein LOC116338348 [Contarinia nasturtii]